MRNLEVRQIGKGLLSTEVSNALLLKKASKFGSTKNNNIARTENEHTWSGRISSGKRENYG